MSSKNTVLSSRESLAPRASHKPDTTQADEPYVSAIIPAYNSEGFIHRAIESALAQSHRCLEIIVVDDGSKDRTAEVASRYPVEVVRKKNGGPASARNAGISVARGEWIAFLDHDDTWHPDKTRLQLSHARKGISAVFSEKIAGSGQVSFDQMFWRNYGGSPSSTIIRRDVLMEIGMFDDDPCVLGVEDYNLWLRFLLSGHYFSVTPQLFEFTPADDHYSGKADKMLAAEIANIEKIGALAGLDRRMIERRLASARLEYLPDLIHDRHLGMARRTVLKLGFDPRAMRYWGAFLPEYLLDLKRRASRFVRGLS